MGLESKKYLDSLNACLKVGRKTAYNISEFLPWNRSREKLMELGANPDDVSKKKINYYKKRAHQKM